MLDKIEHLGIAVIDIDEGIQLYQQLLGGPCYKIEEVESEGVKTAFFKIGESKIELLQATTDDSPIAKFISKKGEGIHHIAYAVTGIEQKIEELQAQGYQMIHDMPKPGADGKKIAFLHPKSTKGVLVELCEDR